MRSQCERTKSSQSETGVVPVDPGLRTRPTSRVMTRSVAQLGPNRTLASCRTRRGMGVQSKRSAKSRA